MTAPPDIRQETHTPTRMLITIAVVGLLLITAFVQVTVVVMRRTTWRDLPYAEPAAARVTNVPLRPVRILPGS